MRTQDLNKKGHNSSPPIFGPCLLWPPGMEVGLGTGHILSDVDPEG